MYQKKNKKILIKTDNCQVRFSNLNQTIICSVLWFSDKSVEFLQENLNNKKRQSIQEKSQISKKYLKIQLDLNYQVSLKQKHGIKQGFIKNQSSLEIVIKNYNNLQKISIQHKTYNSQNQQKVFHDHFSGIVWIKGIISSKYQLVRQMTEKEVGSESQFIVIKDKTTFQNYFVKQYEKKLFIDKQNEELCITPILREIHFQNAIKHSNIMRFNYFFEDKKYFFLFYTQRPARILHRHINLSGQISTVKVKGILRQLLKVIVKLNEADIVHNNLRSSSIFLIESNDKWKVCLGEFQKACYIQDQNQFKYLKNECFLAPQLIKQKLILWRVSLKYLVFYEILFKREFFSSKQFHKRISNQDINFQTTQFKILSQKCLDLFQRMIQYNPFVRISAYEALRHEYFNKSNAQIGDYLLTTMNTTSSVEEFDGVISSIYEKKKFHQNQRVRARYYSPYIAVKPNLNNKRNSFELLSLSQLVQGTVPQQLMDDKHKKLQLRDARIMKPSWRMQRYHLNY